MSKLQRLVDRNGVQAYMNGAQSEMSVFKDGKFVGVRRIGDIVDEMIRDKDVDGASEPSIKQMVSEAAREKNPDASRTRDERVRRLLGDLDPRYRAIQEFMKNHPKRTEKTIEELRKIKEAVDRKSETPEQSLTPGPRPGM